MADSNFREYAEIDSVIQHANGTQLTIIVILSVMICNKTQKRNNHE